MCFKPRVEQCAVTDIRGAQYDVVIATTGFERRARHLVESLKPDGRLRWAPAFANRQVLSFRDNKDFFDNSGFETAIVAEDGFAGLCVEKLRGAASSAPTESLIRILVDISSMTRSRMAAILDTCRFNDFGKALQVDFFYSVGEYEEPPTEYPPMTDIGPVTSGFAGWSSEPTRTVSAIFGVGYEQDQVIGVVESLEAADIWVFIPNGPDPRYLASVQQANETLWDEVPVNKRIKYDVLRPLDTLFKIDSLVYGVLAVQRCVLIPFGPKIFSIICMLVASSYYPNISLWRVSTGQSDVPLDRRGTDTYAGIRATFGDARSGMNQETSSRSKPAGASMAGLV
jgi:hypothetical protein